VNLSVADVRAGTEAARIAQENESSCGPAMLTLSGMMNQLSFFPSSAVLRENVF